MRITRSTFLYLEGTNATFAQCGSCVFGKTRCAIMGDAKVSAAIGSCNFYIKGVPISERPIANLTADQAGYVERRVRCENCKFFGQGHCGLYRQLNKELPELFNLAEKVSRYGCCNANTPA